jgi:hypothetical protein
MEHLLSVLLGERPEISEPECEDDTLIENKFQYHFRNG